MCEKVSFQQGARHPTLSLSFNGCVLTIKKLVRKEGEIAKLVSEQILSCTEQIGE